MKFQDFLSHHGIQRNPFSVEDAQTDAVFKEHCIESTFHPAWDKVFGNPADPSTSVVFGEKGAGKTALRLQTEAHIGRYNREHPDAMCFVIAYDDFNPFLDQFQQHVNRRARPEKLLREFHLWDHIDSILTLGVTRLLDGMFQAGSGGGQRHVHNVLPLPRDYRRKLRSHHRRDLLLLAACYDHSTEVSHATRWHRLRRKLRAWSPGDWNLGIWWPFAVGISGAIAVLAILVLLARNGEASVWKNAEQAIIRYHWWFLGLVLLAWIPWLQRCFSRWWQARGIVRNVRVTPRRTVPLTRILMNLSNAQLDDQPLPDKQRTDDRYSLLAKFQGIISAFGFSSVVVLVDRIDEPHLVNGSPEVMKAFLWPMLDNKFLKLPGLGIKFLLPRELSHFVDRESQEFYQRARLDKQNVVPSLQWTGQALYDVANTRIAACSDREPPARLVDLLDPTLPERRLFDALQSLRVPRHVFRFLYRLISTHCNLHTQDAPSYRIAIDTFESELAVFRRELEAAERGLAAG